MKKIGLTFLVVFALSIPSFAQLGLIAGGCASVACQSGGDYCAYQMLSSIVKYERQVLERKKSEGIKRILSFESQALGGGIAGKESARINTQLRGRINVGIFATDFRYNGMFSNFSTLSKYTNSNTFWDSYKTYDWQILSINFLTTTKFRLQAGVGITTDERNSRRDSVGAVTAISNIRSRKTFFEGVVAANYYMGENDQHRIQVEIRNSPNKALGNQRTEVNLTAYHKIFENKASHLYGIIGGSYTNYYKYNNFYTFYAGIGYNLM